MLDLIIPDWPAPPGVKALQTTRTGGCSEEPYASFNLGDHVQDHPDSVTRNRQALEAQLPNSPLWLEQVHGCRVLNLDIPEERGNRQADAILTRKVGQVCAVMTADCLPVLLCDQQAGVVAAAHAGWRGLLGGVLEATIAAMETPGAELMAWLGPAIGPNAFEVGEEVRRAFMDRDPEVGACFREQGQGKYLADLYGLARHRLHSYGVNAVFGGTFCTYNDPKRFFSYRRDGITGRMATLIWLA